MLIVRIKTKDLFGVTRKFENKMARTLAIISDDQNYNILFAMDEYKER
ncbi:MAG: hypothetical protein PHF24_06275 [Syntrophomonas sp.]|nr:hypothetical protein [Syntrophomonas sp.]